MLMVIEADAQNFSRSRNRRPQPKTRLLIPGDFGHCEYPQLFLDENGVLHAAWTTQQTGEYMYWSIQYMLSPDGGKTWKTPGGSNLSLPVVADNSGETIVVNLDHEFSDHTWLANFTVKDGQAYFVYMTQSQPDFRMTLIRIDTETGEKNLVVEPVLAGEAISFMHMDGFLTYSPDVEDAPLYLIMSQPNKRVGCLVSHDDGETWTDYAVAPAVTNPYSISGSRFLTDDGFVQGVFTDQQYSPADTENPSTVYFFRFPVSGN